MSNALIKRPRWIIYYVQFMFSIMITACITGILCDCIPVSSPASSFWWLESDKWFMPHLTGNKSVFGTQYDSWVHLLDGIWCVCFQWLSADLLIWTKSKAMNIMYNSLMRVKPDLCSRCSFSKVNHLCHKILQQLFLPYTKYHNYSS